MKVTGDGWEVSPADVEALRAGIGTAAPPLRVPSGDPLAQVFEYHRRERTTLAAPEVVMAAAGEILRQRDVIQVLHVQRSLQAAEIQRLRQELARRGQLYGRMVSDLTGGQRAAAGGRQS
jgi:hypothetical protein